MTNKRFKFEVGSGVKVVTDNGEPISDNDALNLLNSLYEEKEEQKLLIDELYLFRLIYNALLFNNWHKHNEIEVYKSKRHHDGSIPFEDDEGEWFIVVAILPNGKQVSNHYPLRYWDYFKIPSYDRMTAKRYKRHFNYLANQLRPHRKYWELWLIHQSWRKEHHMTSRGNYFRIVFLPKRRYWKVNPLSSYLWTKEQKRIWGKFHR